MNCYTSDPSEIRQALMGGSADDLELIGNAVTAIAGIIQRQQSQIEAQQKQIEAQQKQIEAQQKQIEAQNEALGYLIVPLQ